MKLCLVLQRRFAFLGHELAVILKEQHGVAEFCAYVHDRDGYRFLAKQEDVAYSGLILDEDIQKTYRAESLDLEYLNALEKECGNLWSFIGVDRVIRYGQMVREYPNDTSPYSHHDMLRIVQVFGKQLSAFLDRERPDVILAYQPGALGTLLLYALAQKRGIPVLSIVPPVTRNRICVSGRYDRLTGVEEIVKQNLDRPVRELSRHAEAVAFIKEFQDKPSVYSGVYLYLIRHGTWKQLDFILPHKLLRSLTHIWNMCLTFIQDKEKRTDYTTVHPLHYMVDHIRRKIRNVRGVSDLYDPYDPNQSFVFVPLHFEPELSILLLSPFDADQLTIVRRLSRSVPVGTLIYVKEHPQMTPYRPRSFYKELKKIPNVRLLRPNIPSFDIIRRAALVATITGSAGWEATLLRKPVITFGEVFYNAVSSVMRSRIPEELPALVASQLSRAPLPDDELERFVAALFEDSAACDLLYLWEMESDPTKKRAGLAECAELIARKARAVVQAAHH